MLTLAIDTSAGTAVALLDGPEPGRSAVAGAAPAAPVVLARASGTDPRKHAELLAPMVDDVLHRGGRRPADVDLVAVGTGPAPFTGLRVGLVTARTLARALGAEVVGVASLDALARTVLDALGRPAEGAAGEPVAGPGTTDLVVVSDARRREVYCARYATLGAHDVTRLSGPHVTAPADALEACGAGPDTVLAGPGCATAPDLLPATPGLPDAIDLAALARVAHARLARRAAGEDGLELDTEPRYLRRPDIHGVPA